MNPLKLTEEQLIDLWREEAILDKENNDIFVVVEEGDWIDGGKYQDAEIIFKDVRTDKHYSFTITRSGSYFSHYEFEVYDKPDEVKKVTEVITVEKWVLV